MNNLQVIKEIKMDSREIAKLTGKNHQHVRRDIRKQLEEQEIDVSRFGRIYKDSMNRDQAYYELDKKQTLILISGYSIPLRAKIIDRLE